MIQKKRKTLNSNIKCCFHYFYQYFSDRKKQIKSLWKRSFPILKTEAEVLQAKETRDRLASNGIDLFIGSVEFVPGNNFNLPPENNINNVDNNNNNNNDWSPGIINLPPGTNNNLPSGSGSGSVTGSSGSGSGSSDVRSSRNGNNDDVKIIDRSSDVTIRVCRPTECVEVTARHAAIASG